MAQQKIERDAQVMATDGAVGRVSHVVVDPDSREVTEIVVEREGRELLIPIAAVASADKDRVTLRVARSELRHADGFDRDAFRGVDDEDARDESQQRAAHGGAALLDASDDAVTIGAVGAAPPPPPVPMRPTPQPVPVVPAARTGPRDEIRVPVVKERLDVEKQQVELGDVEIRKTVETEQVSVPVEVTRERVDVRRQNVADRPLMAGDMPGAFEDGTIRVPLRGEELVASKEAVITGEVVISRQRVIEQQTFNDTVRREHVSVDENYEKGGSAVSTRSATTSASEVTSGDIAPTDRPGLREDPATNDAGGKSAKNPTRRGDRDSSKRTRR